MMETYHLIHRDSPNAARQRRFVRRILTRDTQTSLGLNEGLANSHCKW
jgi:hypothetical protein